MQAAGIIDKLAKIARAQRMVIYGALYLILAVAFWALLYMPKLDDISTLEGNKRTLLQQKAQVEARVANRDVFEAELAQLNADLVQALKELPNDREIPGLLKGISTLGKKVGLEIRKFQPLPEDKREYVAEVPVSLEVRGSYHEIAMFFDRLSKMNRIVYVQNIEMGDPEERGGKVYLKVTGKAVTFRFLSEEERAPVADTGKKGKGKRRRAKPQAKGGH